ncbi:hypothetical protein GGR50DRAFT_695393 [Xylaria sp. CBS 124048]|nr:hypothetical protein GGR50DRAFT_695393 [Xylaria sp. CBS 124048]
MSFARVLRSTLDASVWCKGVDDAHCVVGIRDPGWGRASSGRDWALHGSPALRSPFESGSIFSPILVDTISSNAHPPAAACPNPNGDAIAGGDDGRVAIGVGVVVVVISTADHGREASESEMAPTTQSAADIRVVHGALSVRMGDERLGDQGAPDEFVPPRFLGACNGKRALGRHDRHDRYERDDNAIPFCALLPRKGQEMPPFPGYSFADPRGNLKASSHRPSGYLQISTAPAPYSQTGSLESRRSSSKSIRAHTGLPFSEFGSSRGPPRLGDGQMVLR